MKIEIDTDIISKLEISISEYILIYLLYHDCREKIVATTEMILNLEAKGFVKDLPEGITLRKKTLDLFNVAVPIKTSSLEEFVENYRNLFPSGVKSGNRLVKGDKHGCLTKLKTFSIKYPEYTKEDILEATKVYIDLCRKRNYDKMTSADYFIEKDKLSMLASYCEDIKTRGVQVVKETGSVGRTKGI